jgi:cell division protein FtsL
VLPDHPWLDRAVRGRAWIAILGVMLAGIVAMQVEVLKLGASIGRSIQRSTTLQTRNEQLRATVGSLNDDQRIEALAAKHGMVMPSPDSVGFLAASQGKQVSRVLGSIRAPDAGSFLALTTDNGAVTTGAGTDPTTPSNAASTAGSPPSTAGSTASTAGSTATTAGSTATQTAVAQVAATSQSPAATSQNSPTDAQSTATPTGG